MNKPRTRPVGRRRTTTGASRPAAIQSHPDRLHETSSDTRWSTTRWRIGSVIVGLATVFGAIFAGIALWPILFPKHHAAFSGPVGFSNPRRTEELGSFFVDHYNDIVQLDISFAAGGAADPSLGPDELTYDQQSNLILGFSLTGACPAGVPNTDPVCDHVNVTFTTPQTPFAAHIIQRVLTSVQVQGFYVVEGVDTHQAWNIKLRALPREQVPST